MKKGLVAVVGAIALGVSVQPVFANEFSDITNNFAQDSIVEFDSLGYFENMIGVDETLFSPSKSMTRGELVVLLLNVLEVPLDEEVEVPFLDMNEIDEVYMPYVTTSYKIGLVEGRLSSDGVRFDFDSLVTREEMVTMIGNYANATSDVEPTFTDTNEISDWAKPFVSYASKKNLVEGYPDGSFKPKANVSRAEAVTIIHNDIEFLNSMDKYSVKMYIGNGDLGYFNGTYGESLLTEVSDITMDADGSLIIADTLSNKIRMASDNQVTDVVGNIFETDFSGLPIGGYIDGLSSNVLLNSPEKILVSDSGMIYFTERESNTIRVYSDKVGVVATLTGDVESGYVNGNIEDARFNKPMGLAEDSQGNLYVADTLNHCIRKINVAGEVSLFAGTPQRSGDEVGNVEIAQFNEPVDIFIDDKDVLYIADAGNNSIKKIENDTVSVVAGAKTEVSSETDTEIGGDRDGQALESLFCYPTDIYVENEVVYVADTFNNKIKKIEDGYVTTIAGNGEYGNNVGTALKSTFQIPRALLVKDGKIYVADSENHSIKVIEEK